MNFPQEIRPRSSVRVEWIRFSLSSKALHVVSSLGTNTKCSLYNVRGSIILVIRNASVLITWGSFIQQHIFTGANATLQWFLTGGHASPGGVRKFPGRREHLTALQHGKFWWGKCSVQFTYLKSGGLKQRQLHKGDVVEKRYHCYIAYNSKFHSKLCVQLQPTVKSSPPLVSPSCTLHGYRAMSSIPSPTNGVVFSCCSKHSKQSWLRKSNVSHFWIWHQTTSVCSKLRNCAHAQCHQTICEVKSHSCALQHSKFNIIYLSHSPQDAWNASLVVCLHCCAIVCSLKQIFAHCKICLVGTLHTAITTCKKVYPHRFISVDNCLPAILVIAHD